MKIQLASFPIQVPFAVNFAAKKRKLSPHECNCLFSIDSVDHAIACRVGDGDIGTIYRKESACAKLFAIQVKCKRTACGIGENLKGNVADHLDVGNGAILCCCRIKCVYQRAAARKVCGIGAPLCLDNGLGVGCGIGIGGRIRIGCGIRSCAFLYNVVSSSIYKRCNSTAACSIADVVPFGENKVFTV